MGDPTPNFLFLSHKIFFCNNENQLTENGQVQSPWSSGKANKHLAQRFAILLKGLGRNRKENERRRERKKKKKEKLRIVINYHSKFMGTLVLARLVSLAHPRLAPPGRSSNLQIIHFRDR